MAVVIYEGYLIVGVYTGVFGEINTRGFSLFMSAAQPWRYLLGPLFGELYGHLGSRGWIFVYLYWLVCTAINAFFVFLVGTFVNLRTVSKLGVLFGAGYIIICLLTWAIVLANIKTLNLSSLTLILLTSPFGLFLSSLLGQLGVVIAMLFNLILLYCVGSSLGLVALKIRANLTSNSVLTPED